MNFISKTLHLILKSLMPKNWKFFSLFLCMFAEILSQFLKLMYSSFSLKFLPLMNFISRTVHQILKSFTPKNCKFFSLFFGIIANFFSIFGYNLKIFSQIFQFTYPCFSLKFFPFMNFISRTVHRILKSFTPKNCNFFSLFLGIIANFFSIFGYNFFSQIFQFTYPSFSLKFFPFMNFISRTVHRILKSFTPKNCKFFSLFFGIIANFFLYFWV